VPLPPGSDYANESNWLALEVKESAPADVFFLYPTTCNLEASQEYCEAGDPDMRAQAQALKEQYFGLFDTTGVYAPYYRQQNFNFMFKTALEGLDAANPLTQLTVNIGKIFTSMEGDPLDDAKRAFAYYMEHHNQGRPILFAGHSQGSMVTQRLLLWVKENYPGLFDRQVVAAYLIGAPVTQKYLDTLGLRFAQSATDTKVVISYNTEGPVLEAMEPLPFPVNPITVLSSPAPALAINPANWSTNLADTATTEYGKAYIRKGTFPVGVQSVVVSDYDPGILNDNWPTGVYHPWDIDIFYDQLHRNVRDRIQEYCTNVQ
jgi:hypothetical protein